VTVKTSVIVSQCWCRSDGNIHCSRQHDATDPRHSDC